MSDPCPYHLEWSLGDGYKVLVSIPHNIMLPVPDQDLFKISLFVVYLDLCQDLCKIPHLI